MAAPVLASGWYLTSLLDPPLHEGIYINFAPLSTIYQGYCFHCLQLKLRLKKEDSSLKRLRKVSSKQNLTAHRVMCALLVPRNTWRHVCTVNFGL